MSANVAKLKKQAAELEQKRQLDKALAKYIQILGALDDQHLDESDIALFNRVGDLLMRQGKVSEAVDYYEKAVDHYTEGGFFNNAIALCNKILRNAPGRTSVYYKLGRISAKKGFIADAKQSFLEYADRMQQAGRTDDAFRALAELADLCPDQEDIRLMLADQLAKSERRGEAIEQLQRLYEKMESEGRSREARATVERMRAIDPDVAPRTGSTTPVSKSRDLVFLDVNYDAPGIPARAPEVPPPPRSAAPPPGSAALPPLSAAPPPLPEFVPESADPAGPEEAELAAVMDDSQMLGVAGNGAESDLLIERIPVEGFEPARFEADTPPLEGLEQTTLSMESTFDEVEVPGLSHSLLEGMEVGSDAAVGIVDVDDAFAVPERAATGAEAGEIQQEDESSGVEPEEVAALADVAALEDEIAGDGLSGIEILNEQALDVDEDAAGSIQLAPGAKSPIGADAVVAADEGTAMDLLAHSSLDVSLEPEEVGRDLGEDGLDTLIEIDLDDDSLGDDEAAGTRSSPSELAFLDVDEAQAPSSGESEWPVPGATDEDVGSDEQIGGDLPLISTGPEAGLGSGFEPAEPWSPDEPMSAPADPDLAESSDLPPIVSDALDVSLDPVARHRAAVEASPDDGHARQQLGEALVEVGDRDSGLEAMEEAVAAFERAQDFAHGRSVVEQILRLEPNSIRHHQKRVEFAFRIGDRTRLVDAYLALADCLFRSGEVDKCRAVLARVAELAPEDRRALESMRAIDPAMVTPTEDVEAIVIEEPAPAATASVGNAVQGADEFVDLASWLAEDGAEKSTRMVADVAEPENESDVDFQRMLEMFKKGVAQNVEEADHESHYDLGVAYKEMGLLDEAIAEFQKALRGTENRVRTYEALGQCFVEKRQYPVALTILSRATADRRYSDEVLVGVLYLLGTAHESLGQDSEARSYYERVIAIDIGFRDVTNRLAALEGAA